MTNFISFTNLAKSAMTLAIVAVMATASVVSAASASDVPSCTISVAPAAITSAQSATLKWISTTGAVFASLDNGIGSIAPDGELVVSPNSSTVYTMHTWNTIGSGGYCSVALTVDGNGVITNNIQPTVTLQTLAIRPASTQVTLGNVPYTGPVEDAVYTLFLLTLLLTAGYVVKTQRKTIFA